MKRILVTGGTGFIGRHVLSQLAAAGHELHAVSSRSLSPGDQELSSLARCWHRVDLLSPLEAEGVVHDVQPEILFHLAWSVESGAYDDDYHRRWLAASRRLVATFLETGGERTVVAGSCFEYDWSDGLCSERRTPTVPTTNYGRCKNELRQFIQDESERKGRSWAWGRIFFVFGPGERAERFVAAVILGLLRDEVVACTHGLQVRDYLHSREVASALVRLFESGFNGVCNIASGEEITLRGLAGIISSILGKKHLLQFGAKPAPPHEPPVIVGDTERLKKQVGWSPGLTLEEGLKETIAYWKRKLDCERMA